MKKVLLIGMILCCMNLFYVYIYANMFVETTFKVHTCDNVEVVDCENGTIAKKHMLLAPVQAECVIEDYSMNIFSNADKGITKAYLPVNEVIKECEISHFGGFSVVPQVPIVKIEKEAFKDCIKLEEINFSLLDKQYRYSATIFNVPILVEENAFENCVSLEGVRFPQKKSLRGYSFEVPHYVMHYNTTIGEYAFKNCTNLKYVIIDGLDTVIKENAFYGCPDVVIYCKNGSKAEEYAKVNNIKYVLMDNEYSDLEKAIFNYDIYSKNVPGLLEAAAADFYKSDDSNYDNSDDLCTTYDLLLADWVQRGVEEGIQGSRVFDAEYYKAANPDVVKVWGDSYTAMYNHFIKYGVEGLRKSSPEYCGSAYKNRYSDLADKTGEELIKHYVVYGVRGNRNARVEPVGGVYGDVNGDKVLSAADSAIILQKALVNTITFNVDDKYADVDKDGSITAKDASLVMQKVLNSAFAFPT